MLTAKKVVMNMKEVLMTSMTNICYAMLIFLCAYLANMSFSMYYNIKILLQPFEKGKIVNSCIKVATFIVGLSLLCISITCLPLFASQVGWVIPEEYAEAFSAMVIIGSVLTVACKYIVEALQKFTAILKAEKYIQKQETLKFMVD